MSEKFSLETKFFRAADKMKFRLYANEGKNGINLGASRKTPDMERAETGMQETVQSQDEARARMTQLTNEALAEGFVIRKETGSGQIGRRSKFVGIPKSPGSVPVATTVASVPVPEPVVETSSEPTTTEDLENLVAAGGSDIRSNKSGRRR